MATAAFPKVPSRAWRTLRSKAATAPSTKFTPAVVAASLGMASPKSAADNIVYPLRKLGLINEDGSLTEIGNKWRLDGSYASACDEIVAAIYPDDLSGLTNSDGTPDQQQILTWFQHKGFGESNAKQMAATYVMIASKQVPEVAAAANDQARTPTGSAKKPAAKVSAPTKAAARAKDHPAEDTPPPPPPPPPGSGPNLHLDIQIHLPAEATPAQIDQVFASMAKHLYKQ